MADNAVSRLVLKGTYLASVWDAVGGLRTGILGVRGQSASVGTALDSTGAEMW